MAQPAQRARFNACTVLRRALALSGTLDVDTGASHGERYEWHIQPCGAPLLTTQARTVTGACAVCAAGWSHIHNYSISEPVQGPCPETCVCRRAP